jgi:hypothetical protein
MVKDVEPLEKRSWLRRKGERSSNIRGKAGWGADGMKRNVWGKVKS